MGRLRVDSVLRRTRDEREKPHWKGNWTEVRSKLKNVREANCLIFVPPASTGSAGVHQVTAATPVHCLSNFTLS